MENFSLFAANGIGIQQTCPSMLSPNCLQRHKTRRLCTGTRREDAEVFLFSQEALCTRVSRAHSSVVSSLPPNVRELFVIVVIKAVLSFFLFRWSLEKHCFVIVPYTASYIRGWIQMVLAPNDLFSWNNKYNKYDEYNVIDTFTCLLLSCAH
jgi:hypothetical protein